MRLASNAWFLTAFVLVSLTCALPQTAIAQSCIAAPAGLTSWWPGDGSTDDITSGHNATLNGGAAYNTGRAGQAFELDGTDDYVEIASDPALDVGAGDFTVDLWVWFNSTDGEQVLIEKWIDFGGSGWTLTKLGSNQIQLAMVGSGNPTSGVQTIPTGSWVHFAARRSGGSASVFMNGTEIVSGGVGGDLSSPTSLKIGRRGDGRGFFLNGRVDEVHFFVGTALSDAQIQDIYDAAGGGLCSSAVCGDGVRQGTEACDDGNAIAGDGCENDCTPSCGNGTVTGSEECDDGNLIDGDDCDSNCRPTGCPNGVRTGSEGCDDGNMVDTDACKSDCTANVCGDGIVNAGVEACDDANPDEFDGCESDCTFGEVCIAPLSGLLSWWPGENGAADIAGARNAELKQGADYGAGKVGLAFALDGVDDFVAATSHPSLNVGTADFTVDAWVNFDRTDGEQVLVEKYIEKFNPAASRGWTLTKLGNNVVRFVAQTDGVDTSRLAIVPNTWLHFAARRSGSALAIFLNGARVASGATHQTADLTSSASLKLGHRGGPLDTPGSTDTRGFFLAGRIDEVHVFGRALTDLEISSLYNTGGAGLCVPIPACGNGLTEAGEACDDGNAVADDGCENDCSLSCGNGVVSAGEACDDANGVEGDGCDTNCSVSGCGNDIAAGAEACDDGNLDDGDGCDSNCTVTACGNGVRTAASGEDCDDGNLDNGDGCENDCTPTPVAATLPPGGGTVTTDPSGAGASPQVPIQTAVSTPNGGFVSIATSNEPLSQDGVHSLINSLLIQAPPATAAEPLKVVVTIDASAIPPGVDLLRMVLTRNGVVLENCSGTPGTADPNPCISSRELLGDGDVQITGLTSRASSWNVVVRGLVKDEQKCVNGVDLAGHKVARAQSKLSAGCLKKANAGAQSDPQTCALSDAQGDVAKAAAKTTDFSNGACGAVPPFAFTGAAAVNAAARQAGLDLTADVFGDDLNDAVAADSAVATCQAAVLKGIDKVFDTKAKLFLACQKDGLGGKPQLMVSAPQLAGCFAAVAADADSKAAKSVGKLAGALIKKCAGVSIAEALPGSCAASDDMSLCLETRVNCRVCQLLDAMNELAHDCDRFDDNAVNASCE